MKTFLKIAILLACLAVPAAQAATTPVSALPATNAVQSQDNVIVNSTNTGTGLFTTSRATVSTIANFGIAQMVSQGNSFTAYQQFLGASNKVIATLWHVPTNIVNGLGTISISGSTLTLTGSTVSANGVNRGTQIQRPQAQGGGQWWVDDIIDNTHLTIHPFGAVGVSGNNWTNYPPCDWITDINGLIQAAIGIRRHLWHVVWRGQFHRLQRQRRRLSFVGRAELHELDHAGGGQRRGALRRIVCRVFPGQRARAGNVGVLTGPGLLARGHGRWRGVQ